MYGSFATIANWCGLDYRTVEKCIQELEFKRVIVELPRGTPRSTMDLPGWTVPAAKFDMSKKGWVPVPSFIITDTCPHILRAFCCQSSSTIRTYGRKIPATRGIAELTQRIGCGVRLCRRVYDAIRLMGNKKNWRALGTGLPRPLEILRTEFTKASRHFSVRAIYYHHEKKCGPPELFLTKEFTRFFKVGYKKKRG